MNRRDRTTAGWIPLAVLVAGLVLVSALATRGAARAAGQDGVQVVATDVHLQVFDQGRWWGFEATILVGVGPGDRLEALREAQDAVAARFPVAIRQELSSGTSQFVLSGHSWPTHTVGWSYNPAGKPASLAGDAAAIGAGAADWALTGADFHFTALGTTTAGTGACSGAAANMDRANTVGWNAQSGSTLAVTCSWFDAGSFVEFDMEFDPDWPWTTGETGVNVDTHSVATHEFGHALGLGHSSSPSAVMFAPYTTGTLRRTPHCDDIQGVIAIYGGTLPGSCSGGPTATGTPTATRTATALPTATSTPPGLTPSPSPKATPAPTAAATPTPPSPSAVVLRPGANLATWPAVSTSPATMHADSTATEATSIEAIYWWDSARGQWLRWLPGLPDQANTLLTLETGDAYWFFVRSTTGVGLSLVPVTGP